MRKIPTSQITRIVEHLCVNLNYNLSLDIISAIKSACRRESLSLAKNTLKQILENSRIAKKRKLPLCQDTGAIEAFVELGRDYCVDGGLISDALNNGVRAAYKKHDFRQSIVSDPIKRVNTFNNTPISIYFSEAKTKRIKIGIMLKGAGSENSSAMKFFPPSACWNEIENYIVEFVKEKAAYACPPVIVSVALGGNFSSAPLAAKKALFRKVHSTNKNKFYATKEKKLLKRINSLKIGPMGTGGKTTALAVFISALPTHIASLPCAITLQCHSLRRGEIIL